MCACVCVCGGGGTQSPNFTHNQHLIEVISNWMAKRNDVENDVTASHRLKWSQTIEFD